MRNQRALSCLNFQYTETWARVVGPEKITNYLKIALKH